MSEEEQGVDPFELISGLSKPEQYTAEDQHRDLRAVFLGSTEGQRVLRLILHWCHMYRINQLVAPVDPYVMAAQTAEQNFGKKLIRALTTPPLSKPTKQTRT